ncbi:uncharacterized protein LOC129591052 isoform X2 [Paramacrobiotus metropolitanus]|uniref:uncharacterized protein LOC129591052 isoform X2 n=1 Tax=Paramacrobiotus metropolitanus TaxID=2943436 RepID=UPI0024458891|nr:uncharacterized protein LOC129591052 isoform X2 [Paramacrobiotus metropolitanus]
MEKFLIFPIHQPEYATHGSGNGLYDPFVVDIWGNSGEFQRGYVCDVDEHGLSVKLDGHTVQRVPFGRAWLVKQQDFQESAIHLNSGDVDVRISPTDMGVASWTPARLVNSISCASTEMYKCSSCPYSVATVEVIQPGTMATRYTVIDGPTALAQRLRKRRDLGPLVPQKAFQKVHMRMFDASAEYPYPERLMRTARSSPRFQNFWLRLTRTMLVSLHDGYTEVLLPPDFEKYCSREDDDNEGDDHCRPVWKSIGDFVDRLLVMQHRTVDRILDGLVIALLQSHEIHDNELCFDELFFEIQLFVYSYLDIFDQNLVKSLVNSNIIQSCVNVPTRPTFDAVNPDIAGSTRSPWMWKESFAFAHLLARTVTRHCRILCIIGEWDNCLFSLVQLLNFLSLKLKWLVIADNAELYIREFLDFPKPNNVLNFSEPDVYTVTFYESPAYGTICDNILLRNCVFPVQNSITFPGVLHEEKMRIIDCPLYFRYTDTFSVSVTSYSFSFIGTTKADYLVSVTHMFEVFCPELESIKLDRLLDGLSIFPLQTHHQGLLQWAFMRASFMLWSSPSPDTISDIQNAIVKGASQRKLVTQTLHLLTFLQRPL